MEPKDDLDIAMDGIRRLERREQDIMGDRVTVRDRDAELARIRADLRRLKPVRDKWVKRQFFSGWFPGCGFPWPDVA